MFKITYTLCYHQQIHPHPSLFVNPYICSRGINVVGYDIKSSYEYQLSVTLNFNSFKNSSQTQILMTTVTFADASLLKGHLSRLFQDFKTLGIPYINSHWLLNTLSHFKNLISSILFC